MKVLHIATGFQLSYPGGITNYVRTLAKSQLISGHEVHALARPETDPAQLAGIILHPYLPSEVVSHSLRNLSTDPSEAFVTSLIEREKFDIIHFHMGLELSSGFLKYFATLRIPYVVSLHDYFFICPRINMIDAYSRVCHEVKIEKCNVCIGKLDQIDLLRRVANKFKFTLPRVYSTVAEQRLLSMREFLTNASMLLSVSTRTAEIYKTAAPEARMVVEQIGSASVSGTGTKTPSNKIRVVALGQLSKHKGADLLQTLLTRVRRPDMEFHFHGRAIEGYGHKLNSLGLQCHGPYKPSDIPTIMSASDIGLVLSIWEDNGPQVAMEFINHKTPVLGTRRGGIPDIVSPDSGHLFDPDRIEEVDKAVQWLQQITAVEIQQISAGIRSLKTPDQHARRISTLYEEAVKVHSRQSSTPEPDRGIAGSSLPETTDSI